jgi:hypothetical protein
MPGRTAAARDPAARGVAGNRQTPASWGESVRGGRYRCGMTVRVAGLALVLLAGLGSACTSGGPDQSQAGASPSTSPAASTASGSATPSATPTPSLPGGCDQLLPFTDLDHALGRPLFGQSRYVLGVAEPKIGRTGRVTCQYGLAADGRGPAQLEVGVSTYKDADSATDRIAATVAALRANATSQKTASVAGQEATTIGTKTDYNLVVAQGDRTVAVTLSRKLTGVKLDSAAIAVAERVLANWGR